MQTTTDQEEEVTSPTPKGSWKIQQQQRAERESLREERFRARQRELVADKDLDPREREWYLDRTLLTSIEQAALLGLTPVRVFQLRPGHGAEIDEQGEYIATDVSDARGKQVELGRLLEWAVKYRGYTLNVETGALIKGRRRGGGRKREDRATLTRPRQKPE